MDAVLLTDTGAVVDHASISVEKEVPTGSGYSNLVPIDSTCVRNGKVRITGLSAGYYWIEATADNPLLKGTDRFHICSDTTRVITLRPDDRVGFRGRIAILHYDIQEPVDSNSFLLRNPRMAVQTDTRACCIWICLNSAMNTYDIVTNIDGTFSESVAPGSYELTIQESFLSYDHSPYWRMVLEPYYHAVIDIKDSTPVVLPFIMNDEKWQAFGFVHSSQRVEPGTWKPLSTIDP